VAPLSGTKNSTTGASLVQTITGATISSRAVIRIINEAVARWQPRLAAFDRQGIR
jgi:Na+-translocating ferredoxin:NAD+ oxidoreductase RnfG subunit